jgi:5-methylcytosine-specific restriction endonuclease McrA
LSPENKLQYRKTCNANPSNKVYRREWQLANKERVSAYSRKWAAKIPPEFLARKRKEYRERNPDLFAMHSVKRRSSEKAAMPHWLSEEDKKKMNLIYLKRDFINDVTGVKHEVDHIYPIQGRDSCGLHVPWNLRVITSSENRRKKNSLPSHA